MRFVRRLSVILSVLLISTAAFAAKGNPVGKVDTVKGAVTLARAGEPVKFADAGIADPVYEGDTIKTGPESHVLLKFNDTSEIKLTSNSTCVIKKKDASKRRVRDTKLELFSGAMRVNVKKKTARIKFDVTTPTAVAGVRGTDFLVEVPAPDVTNVVVFDGRVQVWDALMQQAVTVTQNQMTAVLRGAPPGEPENVPDQQMATIDASMSTAGAGGGDGNGDDDGNGDGDGDVTPPDGDNGTGDGDDGDLPPVDDGGPAPEDMVDEKVVDEVIHPDVAPETDDDLEIRLEDLPGPPPPPAG